MTVVAAAGIVLALRAPALPLMPAPAGYPPVSLLLVVAGALLLAEFGQALVEFRTQAYAFSLTGIPLVLGFLYLPPQQLIAVRVVTALLVFAIQRANPLKVGFNTSLYLLDTALAVGALHLLLPDQPGLSLSTGIVVYLAPAASDLVMSALVMLVIRVNGGPISWPGVLHVWVPTAVCALLNAILGLAGAVLLKQGPLGGVLLLGLAALTGVAYRGYLVLRRRHQSLQVVQRFVELGEEAGAQEQAAVMLAEIRGLVRARAVELTLAGRDGEPGVRIVCDETGLVLAVPDGRPYAEGLTDRPALITGRDPAQRAWLREQGLQSAAAVPVTRHGATAMLSPLQGGSGHGRRRQSMLVAVDRLGDKFTFTRHDLALMQALAGHLAVALRNTQLVASLRREARHDSLTGLANRAVLDERLADALERGRQPSVLLLDLDRFKEVNDALGHQVGNLLLQVVARRLEDLLTADGRTGGTDATVVRLGGDEFAVLLPDGLDPVPTAWAVAEQLSAPVDLGEVTVGSKASIGVALAADDPDRTATGDDLIRRADVAMYAAKAAGAVVWRYTEDLDAGRGERLALLSDLHLGLERDELQLHYQPKLDLASGTVTGVEALVRWEHPTQGRIAPDVLIPLAESTGMIDKLTRVVLGQALRQSRAWHDQGLDLTVAVNLSTRNLLNPGLAGEVTAALEAHGVPAERLILEITESSVMGDAERTLPVLERLAGAGIMLSLDDFGTGYSSLSYLQRLPVSEVKIDRSFVLGLTGGDETSTVLVRSIISLGASLRLRIVAEGVEDAGTLEQLRELGCDVIQGWHTGRPVPAAELTASLLGATVAGRPAPASRTRSPATPRPSRG